MNNIPSDLRNFDFTWSSCAFEHLGSLEHGLRFVLRQMGCLKPGGFAVHTTEYNVSSNRETVDETQTALFRRQDIERLVSDLRDDNHVIDVDFTTGRTPADLHVDEPPFTETHLKMPRERLCDDVGWADNREESLVARWYKPCGLGQIGLVRCMPATCTSTRRAGSVGR